MKKYAFNCWKILKTIKPQRKIEINLNVMVTKVEKINCMKTRLNPLFFFNGQSAAKPRTEEGSTTIPLWEYNRINKFIGKGRIYSDLIVYICTNN